MTLRTITFDDSTHKIVPRELSDEMLRSTLGDIGFFNSEYIAVLKRKYCALVEAAPEYQEPDVQILFAYFIPACGMFTRSKDERDKWVDNGHEVLPLYVIPEPYHDIGKDE